MSPFQIVRIRLPVVKRVVSCFPVARSFLPFLFIIGYWLLVIEYWILSPRLPVSLSPFQIVRIRLPVVKGLSVVSPLRGRSFLSYFLFLIGYWLFVIEYWILSPCLRFRLSKKLSVVKELSVVSPLRGRSFLSCFLFLIGYWLLVIEYWILSPSLPVSRSPSLRFRLSKKVAGCQRVVSCFPVTRSFLPFLFLISYWILVIRH